MTETKTQICVVKFSSTFRRYFSSTGRNLPQRCACCSADSSVYSVLCNCVELDIL